MPDYRKRLTLGNSSGSRVMILQCNKSEGPTSVKHYRDDGSIGWAEKKVVSWHPDKKTPKILHVPVLSEEVYEISGQPVISGLYGFYTDAKKVVWYSPISPADRASLFAGKKAGNSFRRTLIELGKKVF